MRLGIVWHSTNSFSPPIRKPSFGNLVDDSRGPRFVLLIDSDGATGILDTILGYDSALIEAVRLFHSGHAPLRTGSTNPITFVKVIL